MFAGHTRVFLPLWMIAIACLSGCLDPIQIVGKSCPCPSSYTCVANQCVLPGQTAPPDCTPTFRTSGFRPAWVTPNSIDWHWQVDGEEDAHSRYELRWATSEADLSTDRAVVVGAQENPELGSYGLPYLGDTVVSTTSRGHEARTSYFAQLWAYDINNCAHVSQVGTITTAPAPSMPEAAIALVGTEPVTTGETCGNYANGQIEYHPICQGFSEPGPDGQPPTPLAAICPGDAPSGNDGPAAACWQNFRVEGDHDFSLIGRAFDNAYIEFELSVPPGLDTLYASVWLISGPLHHSLEPVSFIGDGEFHAYQVPLSALLRQPMSGEMDTGERPPLTSDVLSGAGGYTQFILGTSWPHDQSIFIRNAFIYW